MPELPEVEIICRALEKETLGKNILKAKRLTNLKLRIPIYEKLDDEITGKKILQIARRAKYIQLHLEKDLTLIIHLGMSGKLLLKSKDYIPKKHDHFMIELQDNRKIIYHDPRRFGLLTIENTAALETNILFANLGIEPFSKDFSFSWFKNILKTRKQPIKSTIMDNKIIVGVGNIYAAESLFLSRIDPQKESKKLTDQEIYLLRENIIKVLKESIEKGGSSIKDYTSISGDVGNFQSSFNVYGRAKKDCFNCGGEIKQIKQAGRSSFYCPACQK